MVAAPRSPTAHSNKNMRNLDNQMMLYFSDKSLIFKLYYYILVNTETLTHTRRQKKSNLLIIHWNEKKNTEIPLARRKIFRQIYQFELMKFHQSILIDFLKDFFPCPTKLTAANTNKHTYTQVNGYHNYYNYILALSKMQSSKQNKNLLVKTHNSLDGTKTYLK